MEEGGGFEPPESYPSMVFETIPFGRSGTLPYEKGYRRSEQSRSYKTRCLHLLFALGAGFHCR